MNALWPNGLWSFVFLTIILGGAAAWMSGRAVARRWQGVGTLAFYCLLLALAVRFLQYALFEAELLSTLMLLRELIVMLALGFLGFRITRVGQMVSQYRWQYERAGPFSWRERTAPGRRESA